jgi:hypothetical protein
MQELPRGREREKERPFFLSDDAVHSEKVTYVSALPFLKLLSHM